MFYITFDAWDKDFQTENHEPSRESSDSVIFTTAVSDEGFQRPAVLVRVSMLCVYETP